MHSRQSGGGGSRWNLLVAFVLVAAVAAVYAQTARFELVRFDDGKYVSGSDYLNDGLSVEGVSWAFSGPFASNYFPLTLMSHMADRSLFGAAYGGHHLTSAMIHALNSVLLFFALLYMTGKRFPSAIVAVLFAVHPLNVESVAWIAERKNVLSSTFWMLSMGSYCAYARHGGALRYLGAALFLAAGLLSKPMLVTLPLVFLLLDYWPLRRIAWGAQDAGKKTAACAPRPVGFLLLEKLPLLTLSVASSWATLYVQRSTVMASEAIGWSQRLANASVAYVQYLGKLVWPSGLTMHYPHPYATAAGGTGLELWQVVSSAAVLIVLSVLAVRRRYLTVGWLWFVGTLVPMIGVVQVGNQAFADRYAYVPAIGIFIAIVWAGSESVARLRPGSRSIAAASIAVVVGLFALGGVAHQQAGHWQDSVTLFEHVVDVIPRNPKIRYNLANEYRAREQHEVAIRHYRTALETDSEALNLRINLANSLKSVGELEAAVEMYESVLAREPDSAVAHNNLGATLLEQGQIEPAISSLERAISIEPMRINSHITLGDALRERGDTEAAIVQYTNAIQAGSKRAKPWRRLGESLVAAGRRDDAILIYRRAAALRPDDARFHNDLGELLDERGEVDPAIAAYRDALRADPEFDAAKTNLDRILGERRHSDE
jgi:tetratricopeptide (TPR) repeat protein